MQKKLCLLLLHTALLLSSTFLSAQIYWTDSMTVTTTSSYITAPRINTLDDGTLVVVWGETGSPSKIWCSRMDNGAFTPPVSAVNTTPAPSLFGFGGFDVAVAGQKIFVVFERSNGIYLSRSEDGGLSFLPPVSVQLNSPGVYATLAAIAMDESGNIFINYIRETNSSATQQIRRSEDGGLTFLAASDAGTPADGNKVCECCIGAPLAQNGMVWLAFRNNNSNIRDHWVSRSTDLGSTFDTAVDIDSSDWLINVCPISGPRITRSGDSLLVAWKTGAGGGSKVFISTLNSETMEAGQQIRILDTTQPEITQSQPEIVAAGDTIALAFQESGDIIAFRSSITGVNGLDGPATRFEIPGNTLQYPTLTYSGGAFHLIYTDATDGMVVYRKGSFTPVSAVAEPARNISRSDCPVCTNYLNLPPTEGASRATIFDLSGRLTGQYSVSNIRMGQLDVSGLSPGIYILQLSASDGQPLLAQRFLKE